MPRGRTAEQLPSIKNPANDDGVLLGQGSQIVRQPYSDFLERVATDGYLDPVIEARDETRTIRDDLYAKSNEGFFDGDKGPTGDQGPVGDKGPLGDQGPTGNKGPLGDKGPTGDQGITGSVGPTGATGSKGPTGDKGLTGDTGAAGATGATGTTGAQGPVGDKGPTGDKGPIGDKGLTGDKGPTGDQGPSNETGASILSKLQTVDGAGSGLDADTVDGLEAAFLRAWANITGKPSTFPPDTHTHTASQISDASANGRSLITAADYAAMRTLLGLVPGTNVQAYDADLQAIAALTTTAFGRSVLTQADAATLLSLIGGAPLTSPTFTGTPAAPTPAAGDNSTRLATTAFVAANSASVTKATGSDVIAGTDDTKYPTAKSIGDARAVSSDVYARAAGKLLTADRVGNIIEKASPVGRLSNTLAVGPLATATSNVAQSANVIYLIPVYVPQDITISKIQVEIISGASGNLRVGVYQMADGAVGVGSLLVDSGDFSAATTGLRPIPVASTLLKQGMHLFAFHSSVGVTPKCVSAGAVATLGWSSNSMVAISGVTSAQTYGALPTTLGTLTLQTAAVPLLTGFA